MLQNHARRGEQAMKKVLTHKQRKTARKFFAKKPHATRAFTDKDYASLPKGDN
jgi:hypothetical protein